MKKKTPFSANIIYQLRKNGPFGTKKMLPIQNEVHNILDYRKSKLDGLMKNEIFKTLKRNTVPSGTIINGVRFVTPSK